MAKKTEQQKELDKLQAEIKAIQAEADKHIKESGMAPRQLEDKLLGLQAGLAHLQAQE